MPHAPTIANALARLQLKLLYVHSVQTNTIRPKCAAFTAQASVGGWDVCVRLAMHRRKIMMMNLQ